MFRFLSNSLNPVLIGVFIAVGVLLIAGIVLFFVLRKSGGNNKKVAVDSEWFDALGGKENIIEATAVGSRLSLKLNDKEQINRDKLKELGVSSILVMSNKVTLVIEKQAEKVANYINDSLLK